MCRAGVREGVRCPGEGWRDAAQAGCSGGRLVDGNSTGAVSGAGTGTASPDGPSGNVTGQD